jgi:parallel beta-helix repeat protein
MLQRYALEKLFALLLLTVAVCLLADAAQSATIVVNPGDSIQAAIDASTPDDTILVNSGIYRENVNVTKKLILHGVDKGAGMPVVDAKGNGSAITLSADEIILEGFVVTNSSGYFNAGIKVLSNNNAIKNNSAFNNELGGIYFLGSCNNNISGNIASNSENGIILEYSSNNNITSSSANNNEFAGIGIVESYNNTISSNNVYDNGYGIYIFYSGNNTISGNSNSNNEFIGIALSDCSNNIISGNSNNNNEVIGILLSDCCNNTISGNCDSNNEWSGIYLSSSDNNTISGNNATHNGDGIYIFYSDNNSISSNICSNNEWGGILLWHSNNNDFTGNNICSNKDEGIGLSHSSNNSIYLNNFINNNPNADSHSTNLWNSPQPLIYIYNGLIFENYMGNYWSDYNGTDANDDGIGDDPYRFTSEEDNYPLMMGSENYIVSPRLNIDEIEMGSQDAKSYGLSSSGPFSPFDEVPIAANNIDIQKSQITNGAFREFGPAKFNVELIEMEDQMATTSGSGKSTNSITIRTAQE